MINSKGVRYLAISVFIFSGLFLTGHISSAAAPTAALFLSDGTVLENFPDVSAGSSVAIGDLDKDGIPEIVIGSAPGERPAVDIYESDGTRIRSFNVYGAGMTTGINVAVGDLTGNGNEIITAPRRGAGPHILRFKVNGTQLSPGFFAYSQRFHGGVNLAVGDVNGDGKDELITGAGITGGAHVRAFNASGGVLVNLPPNITYPEESFFGGVVVGAVDYDANGKDEIVVAPQSGRVADVKIFKGRVLQKTFRAFSNFRGGVSLSVNESGGGARVILGAGAGGGPQVLQYNTRTGAINELNVFPFVSSWRGGVTVAFWKYAGQTKFFAVGGSTYLSVAELRSYGATITSTENASGGSNSSWEQKTVSTSDGSFSVRLVKVKLTNTNLKIRSLTGSSKDCYGVPCVTRSLASYVTQVNGFAGINGSYFCPGDYASCAGQAGSFYWLWYNSVTGIFSNSYQNQFNQGPVIAFDTQNRYYYYRTAKDWPGKTTFESVT
ncbi:MAG: FG-GAP and VCBS repeat-containing protein, partial [Patescibacteria group bacterium]